VTNRTSRSARRCHCIQVAGRGDPDRFGRWCQACVAGSVPSGKGRSGRIRLPEARIRLDDIAVVGESRHCPCTEGSPPETPRALFVPKEPHRIVVITTDHIIDGVAHLPQNGSLVAFIDAEHPPFVSMTNVRVRWLADRRLAGRYNFALLQRSHIIGVELQSGGDAAAESFKIPGAAFPADQSWS
jgi:hypothetical protein